MALPNITPRDLIQISSSNLPGSNSDLEESRRTFRDLINREFSTTPRLLTEGDSSIANMANTTSTGGAYSSMTAESMMDGMRRAEATISRQGSLSSRQEYEARMLRATPYQISVDYNPDTLTRRTTETGTLQSTQSDGRQQSATYLYPSGVRELVSYMPSDTVPPTRTRVSSTRSALHDSYMHSVDSQISGYPGGYMPELGVNPNDFKARILSILQDKLSISLSTQRTDVGIEVKVVLELDGREISSDSDLIEINSEET